MLNQALLFLLDALLQPFAALLLLRFHLQWLRAPLRNQFG
jgi:YggT family protein